MAKSTELTHEQVIEALVNLGHVTGWVVNGNQIIVWENSAEQPTDAELRAAL